MSLTNLTDQASGAARCPCGSGLSRERCCDLDWTAAWPDPDGADLELLRRMQPGADPAAAGPFLVELLEKSPTNVTALLLLNELRAGSSPAAAEALLGRIVRIDPNHLAATQALALRLFQRGALIPAEHHARNAVRIAPTDAQSHNLMGMIMTEAQRPQVGEHHYRRAHELLGAPSPILLANLAWNLKNQGRMEESRQLTFSTSGAGLQL